jgi:hypothetical protein
MQTSREDYVRHFSELSDEALMEVPREDLVQVAQDCLDEELARRGLGNAETEEAIEAEPAGPESHEPNMVVVAEYQDVAEADLARSLLRSAGIEAMLMNERMANILNVPMSPGPGICWRRWNPKRRRWRSCNPKSPKKSSRPRRKRRAKRNPKKRNNRPSPTQQPLTEPRPRGRGFGMNPGSSTANSDKLKTAGNI